MTGPRHLGWLLLLSQSPKQERDLELVQSEHGASGDGSLHFVRRMAVIFKDLLFERLSGTHRERKTWTEIFQLLVPTPKGKVTELGTPSWLTSTQVSRGNQACGASAEGWIPSEELRLQSGTLLGAMRRGSPQR